MTSTTGTVGTNPYSDPLLTVSQVRKRFGLGRTFVYYQLAKGRIRGQRRGKWVFIRLSEMRAFMALTPLFVTPDGKKFFEKPGSEPYGGSRACRSVPVRLTLDERAVAEKVARASGITLSDLCRMALADAIEEYGEGAGALRRLGRRPRKKQRG